MSDELTRKIRHIDLGLDAGIGEMLAELVAANRETARNLDRLCDCMEILRRQQEAQEYQWPARLARLFSRRPQIKRKEVQQDINCLRCGGTGFTSMNEVCDCFRLWKLRA